MTHNSTDIYLPRGGRLRVEAIGFLIYIRLYDTRGTLLHEMRCPGGAARPAYRQWLSQLTRSLKKEWEAIK